MPWVSRAGGFGGHISRSPAIDFYHRRTHAKMAKKLRLDILPTRSQQALQEGIVLRLPLRNHDRRYKSSNPPRSACGLVGCGLLVYNKPSRQTMNASHELLTVLHLWYTYLTSILSLACLSQPSSLTPDHSSRMGLSPSKTCSFSFPFSGRLTM